ncbi:hypothetical protein A3B05_00955 [Candidatus Giovannonibacteria bacterium RIFCSPLOWO2_01_FULL_43_160]|uniref:Uncharacterized protein n=2 Tax=Candidatus Giovannoniibacteriota TaxID=1752738 RepID=A0A0G1IXF7_9BACT|nr:MAG: hypothetical protein UV72_C0001G0122 [Candidatus Giovannonibacteria bacterium GW2011_GWB1_43_13]KKS99675.1 MAG: hypothetical protein UV75_C0002G0056 [Candidatus Giovannonibacteria bacterium GW2011_GWA1_43_15]KKT20808.1 MAG: hypothetical protein UW05_C0027G0008 [Candidatus Giovannonibacteria bacterium GW2011_GWC2_43_8]KKT63760.1 MAG: hypothetical protein UW55_C0001G0053 [Candidatus Giovannonibacteria bacterium GW2011_GWA2_44_26]OGF58268.1 MAG: hypothetical protein A2652_00255 [Candidatus
MNIKGISITYDPVKEPIKRFTVKWDLEGEHPPSVEKLVEFVLGARKFIAKAIWWLFLVFVGFGRSEFDRNKV